MARNKKVEILSHDGEVLHPITDGDCVIFPDGETLARKLSEQEEVMYTPEVVNSSPMFKVGEGDSSDYSANVLDGAYQEAVLKGQTYVNTIQEPSADVITLPTPFTEYERTQSKTFTEMQDGTFGLNLVGQSYVNCIQEPSEPSYVALGENLEFQNKKVEYTTDGQIKSAMLNGMTLVNLAKPQIGFMRNGYEYEGNNGGCVNYGDYIRYQPTVGYNVSVALRIFDERTNDFRAVTMSLKTNTKYIAFVKLDNQSTIRDMYVSSTGYNSLNQLGNTQIGLGLQIAKVVFTTPNEFVNRITIGSGLFTATDNYIDVYWFQLFEYQEGMENWDIPYFQGMQSVTMTTELENVCSRYNSSVAKNGKTFTISGSNGRALYLAKNSEISNFNFKQNTKYLMQFKITNLNLDGLESIKLVFSDSSVAKGDALFGDTDNVLITKNGIYRIVLTTSNVVSTSSFVIKGQGVQWESSTSTSRKLTISNIVCIEYQNGMENWDLPYFETTQLMKPLKVQSVSKNLLNPSKFIDNKDINDADGVETENYEACMYNEYIKIDTTKKYYLKRNSNNNHVAIRLYDANKKYLGSIGGIIANGCLIDFTGYENAKFARFRFIKGDFSMDSIINCTQFEESDTATTYAPHQEKTTSALEPITLRAIGNVKDTLDLSTGEYVQRIGEIVLDGSEYFNTSENYFWFISQNLSNENYTTFMLEGRDGKSGSSNFICNKLPNKPTWLTVETGVWADSAIVLTLPTSIATTTLQLKEYLQTNQLRIQYELANPITRKISLEYPNLQTYTDITHVQSIAMDGTLIPNIYLPSDISYRAMLKPNTSYNVIIDREVIDSTNQLTVNLGGTTANITANRTVVTTPSTLSNETLTFSGKDNRLAKAMLIEGSTLINGDLPHFDGIGDVKLGRVVENLCMANEIVDGNGVTTDTYSNNSITSKFTASGSRVYLFNLIKPIQNGKKYFVYAPCSQTCAIGFKTIYNGASLYSIAKTAINNYAILSIDNEILRECRLYIGQLGAMPVDTTMTIRRPIICEYIEGMENWDWESIGYFTGTKNIGNEFMRIGNKNLFDIEDNLHVLTKNTNGRYTVSFHKPLNLPKFKENTSYTLSCSVSKFYDGTYQFPRIRYTDGTTYALYRADKTLNGNPAYVLTSSPSKTISYIDFSYGTNDIVLEFVDFQLEETSSATSYVAHKHNSLHILPDKQIPLTFVQGTIAYAHNGTWENAINNTNTTRIRTQLLDLEPNETYRVSCGHSNHGFGCQGYDNSLLAKSDSGWTYGDYYFTTTKDVHKYAINVRYKDNSNISPSVLHQVRLEKVTDITLRSVGDVKDELDLTRGVYIQRMYEVKLNGFEDWSIHNAYSTDNHLCFYWGYKKIPSYDYNKFGQWGCVINVTPLLIPRGWNSFYAAKADEEGVTFNGDNKQNITIKIRKDRLSSQDVNGFKQWLQSNPITVQYPLETPIEHKINIPMKNELNQTIAKPNGVFTLPLMYSETNHVDINSQIYPKVQSRDYISYPVIASPSNKYTVFHNKVGSTDLTVNLCGTSTTVNTHKNTITTPSTISQYELRLSGANNKVSNVCVFNGDYMNVNVPYVQGMMNAVNPTVKNASLNHANITTSGHTNFYIGRIYKGETYSLKLNRNKNVSYNLVLKYGTAVDGGEEMLKDFISSDFTTFTSNYNGYLYFNGWETVDVDNIMLCLGTYTEQNMPQYEPYKENICEPHSEDIITLRSLPSGVRDELNLQTGEYIQRIGEIVLDGNIDPSIIKVEKRGAVIENRTSLYTKITINEATTQGEWAINTTPTKFTTSRLVNDTTNAYYALMPNTVAKSSGSIQICIDTDLLEAETKDGVIKYLSENPVTYIGELKTPIVKQIDIHNFPHSYKDGHVIIESNNPSTNVTAQMTYRCVTNRSGQIQEHTEQVEKQERQINELETLILENIRLSQNRSQNFLTSLISTLEIEEE